MKRSLQGKPIPKRTKPESDGVFYEYAGAPEKIYAAQAVMAHFFTPRTRFVKKLKLAQDARAYLFQENDRSFAVVWATRDAKPGPIRLTSERLTLIDLMGRSLSERQFVPNGTPVYVAGTSISAENLESGLETMVP